MGFFYERTESPHEVTIRYSKAAVYYYLMWAWIGAALLAWVFGGVFIVLAVLLFASSLVFAMPFWSTNAEIQHAMKNGAVSAKGSKYSLANPLTYVIRKHPEP